MKGKPIYDLMKILFLDDRADRCAAFLTKYSRAVCVKTSAECISMLKRKTWDMVCLDHDLQDGDTGMQVVNWIIQRRALSHSSIPPMFIIHSTNLFPSMQMLYRLKQAGYFAAYVPFDMSSEGPFNI